MEFTIYDNNIIVETKEKNMFNHYKLESNGELTRIKSGYHLYSLVYSPTLLDLEIRIQENLKILLKKSRSNRFYKPDFKTLPAYLVKDKILRKIRVIRYIKPEYFI